MEEENLKEKKKGKFLSILKKKEVWISGLVGMIIGILLIMLLGFLGVPGLGNETIASMKSGKITKNSLYKEMKSYFPITYILEQVDKIILNKKYELTDEQKTEVSTQVDSYISMYQKYYGYTEEQFLKENGFSSKDEFTNYITLDYKRNLAYVDYLKTLVSKEDIEKYYNDNVYGEINTKHILVEVTEDVKEEQALNLANEIISKLNSGTSFDDVAKEYEGKVIFEELGYNGFNSNLATEYVEASKSLENNSYSSEPVKTSYGYHVIYRIDQKDKPTLDEAQDDIVTILGKDLESNDEYLKLKGLIKLREDNGLKFKDSKYKEEYKKYCEQANGENK